MDISSPDNGGNLRVMQIANRHAPFPVQGYGGIERVVAMLHDSLPMQVSIGIEGSYGARVVCSKEQTVASLVDTAANFAAEVDLVLIHHPEMVEPVSSVFGAGRVVEMLHVPYQDTRRFHGSEHLIVGVSADQLAETWVVRPDARVCWHATNVVAPGSGTGGYVAWVGRFMPEKGPVEAIVAAREAGVPIKLAGLATGGTEPAYFAEHVQPLLGADAEWVGPVSSQQRDDFLREACGLLVPTRWREAFGLTVIEAAMVGTPVLGYPAGATRELLDTGIGRVCYGPAELSAAVEFAAGGGFDREVVRQTAELRFSPQVQADNLRAILNTWARRH